MKWLFLPLCLFLSNAVALDVYPAQPVGVSVNLTGTSDEMATVTKTVASSGADYTTIAGALGWFQANHDFDTDGIARIQITDTSSYTISSTLSLTGISGTPDIDGHLEITSNATDPFAGPTINMTHTSSGGYLVSVDFTYIHNLKFHLNNTGNSTECIRVASVDNVLISRNVFIALNDQSDQDGIYVGESDVANLRIDNNVFLGFARAAISLQPGYENKTQSADIDSNSFGVGTQASENDGGAFGVFIESGSTITANIYNSLAYDYRGNAAVDLYRSSGDGGTVTLNGSNNIAEDTSAESNFTSSYDSVIFTESAPASGENAWLTEVNNSDETLLDLSIAGENAYTVTGNGVSRVGSEPDSRQDFSIDIMGNARHATTPDIGAFEFVTAGGGLSIPLAYHHYTKNIGN